MSTSEANSNSLSVWLYLQMRDGEVWGSNSSGVFERKSASLAKFNPSNAIGGRVFGSPENYELISLLGFQCGHVSLRVGCPNSTFNSNAEVENGLMAISPTSNLRDRWHTADQLLYRQYSILATSPHNGCIVEHPVWACFEQLPCFDHIEAENLVRSIVDPRWFWNFYKPDCMNAIYRYCGLTERQWGKGNPGSVRLARQQNVARLVESIDGFAEWKDPRTRNSDAIRFMLYQCRQLLKLVMWYWLQLLGSIDCGDTGFWPLNFPHEALRILKCYSQHV